MAVSDQQKNEVKRLLSEGRKIEAIKYLRSEFSLDLKKAKSLADHIEDEMVPSEFKKPSLRSSRSQGKNTGKLIRGIFFVIGLIFLSIALINFLDNQDQIAGSEQVIGKVIDSPSQPTIEYIYNDTSYYYYSSVSSSPPSYYLGEEVEVFVNPNSPENAIINTITERWFLIIFMGGMGSVFALVGFAVMWLL